MSRKGLLLMMVGVLLMCGGIAILLHIRHTEVTAGESAAVVIESLSKTIVSRSIQPVQMPEISSGAANESEYIIIMGAQYAGILEIPELNLTLPILAECSTQNLESSPCRYTGSAADNDLVIAGHNYTSHFGELLNLEAGDMICFTDVYNQVFQYEVVLIETLAPEGIKEMTAGQYPLTLFTCTYGGQNRVVVRCSYASL